MAEVVRADDEVAHARVVGQRDGDGRRLAARRCALRSRIWRTAARCGASRCERFADGRLERARRRSWSSSRSQAGGERRRGCRRARPRAQEAPRRRARRGAGGRGRGGRGPRASRRPAPAMCAASSICSPRSQLRAWRGDDLAAVEDAHGARSVAMHDQRAAHVGVRDRVVVEVEAHVRRLADVDLDALVGREGVVGQRQQRARSSASKPRARVSARSSGQARSAAGRRTRPRPAR